jgi:hypothetical protein
MQSLVVLLCTWCFLTLVDSEGIVIKGVVFPRAGSAEFLITVLRGVVDRGVYIVGYIIAKAFSFTTSASISLRIAS